MKKIFEIILILMVVLLLGVICVGGYYVINNKKESDKKISELENKIEVISAKKEKIVDNTISNTDVLNNTVETSNLNTTTNQNDNLTPTLTDWKTEYKSAVRSFYEKNDGLASNAIMTEYAIADIDKNGVPELMIKNYTCEADTFVYFFQYENGKVIELGKLGSSHSMYYEMNNANYLLLVNGHMGSEETAKIYVENKQIKSEVLNKRTVPIGEDYKTGDKAITFVNWNETSVIDNY